MQEQEKARHELAEKSKRLSSLELDKCRRAYSKEVEALKKIHGKSNLRRISSTYRRETEVCYILCIVVRA